MLKNITLIICAIALLASCKTDTSQYRKGVYLALEQSPSNLNPLNSSTGYDSEIQGYILQSLISIDVITLEKIPVLAEDFPIITVLNDSTAQLDFTLRKNATWEDGSSVTNKDAEFSIKAQLCPSIAEANGRQYYAQVVKDVIIDDNNPQKFSVICKKEMLFDQKIGSMTMIPKYIYDKAGDLDKFSVADMLAPENKDAAGVVAFGKQFNDVQFQREVVSGSGPYSFNRWVTNQNIVLDKKAGWWGDALAAQAATFTAKPKKITYKFIKEQVSKVVAAKGGEVDAVNNIDPEIYLTELKNNDAVQNDFYFTETPRLGYGYIAFNLSNEKLNDKRVRQALAHALDLDAFIEQNMNGLGSRVVTIVPPFNKKFVNESLKPIPFNLETTTQLLDAAGWVDSDGNGVRDKVIDGKKIELALDILITRSVELRIKLLEQFADNLKKCGVALTLQKVEFDNLLDAANTKEYDMFSMGWGMSITEGDPHSLWAKKGERNYTGFGNAKSESLIKAIKSELDETKRLALQKELQGVIYEEQPYIFLYSKTCNSAVSKQIPNVTATRLEPGFDVTLFEDKIVATK